MFSRKADSLKQQFGKIPDIDYYAGDMDYIRSYYETCRANQVDPFYIDDTTWRDLNMDAVYRRINTGSTTAGEQYLYYMLRRPMNAQQSAAQTELISLMEQEPETRLKLQKRLSRIGRYRKVDISGVLQNHTVSSVWLIVYLALALFLPVSIVLTILFGAPAAILPILSLTVNGILHEYRMHKCDQQIRTVNYCVALVWALHKMRRMAHPKLDSQFQKAYPHLDRLNSLLVIGPVSTTSHNDIASVFMTFFLLDLISFELLGKQLAKHHDDLFVIHEAVGQVDAAINIASYRKSTAHSCTPQIVYHTTKPFIHAKNVVHPLLPQPVLNDLSMEKSLLITGANASGKSTYLKASLLCALLAQTICTAPCDSYNASAFRLFTSMAISDNIQTGESYYIAEIKSLKRILDARCTDTPIFCAIDEVLRGTNTIERIAASTEILKVLSQSNLLCLVATHDAELCSLIGNEYDQAHFQETITENDVLFDYKLKPGMATTRNAIDLLRLIGFDESLVQAAHKRANAYLETGSWDQKKT